MSGILGVELLTLHAEILKLGPMKGLVLCSSMAGLFAIAGFAQHEHENMPGMDMPGMKMDSGSKSGGVFESGTSWIPRSTPHYMWMTAARGWSLMAHGNLIVG